MLAQMCVELFAKILSISAGIYYVSRSWTVEMEVDIVYKNLKCEIRRMILHDIQIAIDKDKVFSWAHTHYAFMWARGCGESLVALAPGLGISSQTGWPEVLCGHTARLPDNCSQNLFAFTNSVVVTMPSSWGACISGHCLLNHPLQ